MARRIFESSNGFRLRAIPLVGAAQADALRVVKRTLDDELAPIGKRRHEERDIGNAAAESTDRVQGVGNHLRSDAVDGAKGGFVSDDAAIRCRTNDGTRGLAAKGKRDHPIRYRGGRSR